MDFFLKKFLFWNTKEFETLLQHLTNMGFKLPALGAIYVYISLI